MDWHKKVFFEFAIKATSGRPVVELHFVERMDISSPTKSMGVFTCDVVNSTVG